MIAKRNKVEGVMRCGRVDANIKRYLEDRLLMTTRAALAHCSRFFVYDSRLLSDVTRMFISRFKFARVCQLIFSFYMFRSSYSAGCVRFLVDWAVAFSLSARQ